MQAALVPAVLTLVACGSQDVRDTEPTVSAQSALTGTYSIDWSCDDAERAILQKAMRAGRIVANSNAYASCFNQ